MTATFSSLGQAVCAKCEYWQYIKGSAAYQNPGSTVWIPFYPPLYGGATLSSKYQEDGCNTDHGICRYGHRLDAYHCDDMYYADNEINNFGIGMYEKWIGDALFIAEGITYAWKISQYQEIPNGNAIYWLKKGYNDFSGITDPNCSCPK